MLHLSFEKRDHSDSVCKSETSLHCLQHQVMDWVFHTLLQAVLGNTKTQQEQNYNNVFKGVTQEFSLILQNEQNQTIFKFQHVLSYSRLYSVPHWN